jgi:DUF1680 family protein
MRIGAEHPDTFTVFLRIPAWAGHNTSVSVNGRRAEGDPQPGSFFAVHREWKDGDTIEYSIDRPLRLEAIDAQHPGTVALLAGPLTLFAINAPQSRFTRSQLLQASPQGRSGREWRVQSVAAPVTFRSFPDIRDEQYRLYHEVQA